MKINFFTVVFSIITTVIITTSCLKDDTTTYVASKNASITAFSIPGDIETSIDTLTSEGSDTTITVTVDGSEYPFVINQTNRQIYNVDSLPVGTDVSKVVISITADTQYIYFVNSNNKDSIWASTDSMNFEKPVQFKVLSEEGVFGPTYTARINVHNQVPDSLVWSQVSSNFQGNSFTKQKAVTFNNKVMVFAEKDNQVVLTQTDINDGKTWTTPTALNIPDKADYSSVIVWGDKIYILANNKLYASTDASTWSAVNTAPALNKIVANYYQSATDARLYAININNEFVEYNNGPKWTRGVAVPSNFPTSNISYASFESTHNSSIYNTIVVGNSSNSADTTSVAWGNLSTENEWVSYDYNNSSKFLPNLANITMIRYNNSLYAFGGKGNLYNSIEPFSYIYISVNNGISWEKQTSMILFPDNFGTLYSEANGNYSCTVDSNNYIWIMWSKSGEVWKGRVNRLGFVTNN